MALNIIGSGFGRTGTMSMKEALTTLGFGPCHHMIEVMENPAQPPHWKQIAAGEKVDWEQVFDGYHAQVDWPGAHVWPETVKAFPDALVLHTERPEDAWWNSFDKTIGKFFRNYTELELPPPIYEIFDTMYRWFVQENFSDLADRDAVVAAYRRNNERVRDTVPADRLLIYQPGDGWEPLCRFLEVPVPEGEFPHRHPQKEFWEHFGGEPE